MMVWTWAWITAGTAAAGADRAAIADAITRCSTAEEPLPALDDEQMAAILAGEVVRIVRHGDPNQPSTAIGLAILDGGRDGLWIAAQDPHATVDPSLDEFVVRNLGVDHDLWYGHIDLPRPLRDRQWVVESSNAHGLAASTGCWEHRWRLVPDGLPEARGKVATGAYPHVTLDDVDTAIYTPVNHGAWQMATLPTGQTLVSYQATSVVGGAVPDWLVLQLTMARLESVLRDLETRAKTWSPSHYRAGHAPVNGAGGHAIPFFP